MDVSAMLGKMALFTDSLPAKLTFSIQLSQSDLLPNPAQKTDNRYWSGAFGCSGDSVFVG